MISGYNIGSQDVTDYPVRKEDWVVFGRENDAWPSWERPYLTLRLENSARVQQRFIVFCMPIEILGRVLLT